MPGIIEHIRIAFAQGRAESFFIFKMKLEQIWYGVFKYYGLPLGVFVHDKVSQLALRRRRITSAGKE